MSSFIALSSAIFDRLIAPFGHGTPWLDLVIWSVLGGVLALYAYKFTSNQGAIAAAKDRIAMHLLEIRLFRHSPRVVVRATGAILLRNAVYVGHSLVPMVVMLPLMMVVLTQLVAHYAYAPAEPGAVVLLEAQLAEGARPVDVALELPPGVALDAPPVRTADGRAVWRLRAEGEGDHRLRLRLGDAEAEKGWAVGGPPRKVPVLRTQGAEALLYPGEAPLPPGGPFRALRIDVAPRPLPGLPEGEAGVLLAFLGISLAAGFALRGRVGVTF